MKNNLTVHCVVKNEEKWIWFAINSVLDIADEILVYDTGSTDKTLKIINSIKSKKIKLEERGNVSAKQLVTLRSEQLHKTRTEWFLILDGDEVWPKKTKIELLKQIKNAKKSDWAVVVKAWNLIGDVYHFHLESIKYQWPYAPESWKGWANMRVMRKSIPGLHIKGEYPLEAYCDNTNTPVQNYGEKHLVFLKNRYFHATYLMRSTSRKEDRGILNRQKKGKLELGKKLAENTIYPEVFYQKRPKIVADPWIKRKTPEVILGALQTPIKEARRKILKLYNPK